MALFSEAELILPSLYMLEMSGGFITTSDLIAKLTVLLKPTGKDAQLISGRQDTHFSQKVRNLKSHETLEKLGFADYVASQNGFKITEKGLAHLEANRLTINYLMESNFAWEDVKPALIIVAEPDVKVEIFQEITEGGSETKQTKVYKRSQKLRDAAISIFLQNHGALVCEIC